MNHTVTTQPAAERPVRYHYMDNLRALAMLLGVFFHAALAYSPMTHFVWLTAEKEKSEMLDAFAWFSHLFRMPLFFLIAGFFAYYLLSKRGLPAFLRNRGLRVLLPLLIFLPLVMWSIESGIDWALQEVSQPSLLLTFIGIARNNPAAPEAPFSLAHLWFLYYLLQLYVLFAVLWKSRFFKTRLALFMTSRIYLLLVLTLFLAAAQVTQTAPHPAPEGLLPQFWALGFYGLFFLTGACLYLHQERLQRLQLFKWPLLLVALALYAILYTKLPAIFAPGLNPDHMLIAALQAWTAICATLFCLLAGMRWLNRSNAIMRYVADASYWIYIIHLPLLFMIQYQLMNRNWPVLLEFILASTLTCAVALLSYALLVRGTFIGLLLNGRRTGRSAKSTTFARVHRIQ